jgi:hypothetical protein
MTDEKITQLTDGTPVATDVVPYVSDPGGATPVAKKSTITNLLSLAGGGDKYPMEARLTLETGVAVSTTDQADKATLYLTPYKGCQIATYDGVSAWSVIELTADLSLDISGYTASKPYDIWVYDNGGTLTLDSTIWTNTTTRATALALQNGVYVKTGATTRRYIGTIYMDAKMHY